MRFSWIARALRETIGLEDPAESPVTPKRRGWSIVVDSEVIFGCAYVVISFSQVCATGVTANDNQRSPMGNGHGGDKLQGEEEEEASARARLRWSRLQGYYMLTPIFKQVRCEENRDPDVCEFFAFLQFPPSSYDWRRPTTPQLVQMQRWRAGLDDTRPKAELYQRARWLADAIEGAHEPNKK